MSPIRKKKLEVYAGAGETVKVDPSDLAALARAGADVDAERKKLNKSFAAIKAAVFGNLLPTDRSRELDDGTVLKVTPPTKEEIDGDVLRAGLLAAVKARKIKRDLVDAVAPVVEVTCVSKPEVAKLRALGIAEVTAAIDAATEIVKAPSRTLTITIPEAA